MNNYIEKYTSKKSINLNFNNDDFYNMFISCFGGISCKATLRDNILLLAYYCPYIDRMIFMSNFNYPSTSRQWFEKCFNGLVNDKLLEVVSEQGMGGKRFYKITKQGILHLREYFPYDDNYKGRITKSKLYAVRHDYMTGYIFCSLLQLGKTFVWNNEDYLVRKGKNKNCLNGIRYDALAYFEVESGNYTLFIEQDMGTETLECLRDKIEQYSNMYNSLAPENDNLCVVFVFDRDVKRELGSAYVARSLKSLLDKIIKSGYDINTNLEDVANEHCGILTDKEKAVIWDILKDNNMFYNYKAQYEDYINNEYFSKYPKIKLCEMLDNDYIYKTGIENELISISDTKMTINDFKKYVLSVDLLKNEMYYFKMNYYKYNFTRRRRLNLIHSMCEDCNIESMLNIKYLYTVLAGMCIPGIPTTLFSNYINYLMPEEYNLYEDIGESAAKYATYDTFDYDEEFIEPLKTRQEFPLDYFKSDYKLLYFRNSCIYKLKEDAPETYIAIENISFDMAAYVRFYFACKYIKYDKKVFLLAIVDDYNDAKEFLDYTFKDAFLYDIVTNPCQDGVGFKLFFILSNDIGKEDKIFTIKRSGVITYIDIKYPDINM